MIDKMIVYVSVPSLGDSFFMLKSWAYQRMSSTSFRPLIRGFFFYIIDAILVRTLASVGFRPLIRGFFFYKKKEING